MGNRRTREFTLKQDDDSTWQRVRNEPRRAVDDVYARGIGIRRLQLLFLPSFADAVALEMRQAGTEWRLFSSRVSEPWPPLSLVGYDQVPFASDKLATYFARVTALSLPLAPYLNNSCGLDGTMFHLAVFGDMFSEWRFQWWSDSPPAWQPLVELTNEMLRMFASSVSSNTE
jgi:hypothetical protein